MSKLKNKILKLVGFSPKTPTTHTNKVICANSTNHVVGGNISWNAGGTVIPSTSSTFSLGKQNIKITNPTFGVQSASPTEERKILTADMVEELIGKRVLMRDYISGMVVESHVWELSMSKKYVKMGSPSPHDYSSGGWMLVQHLHILDILPENHFTEEEIKKHKDSLQLRREQQEQDPESFLINL